MKKLFNLAMFQILWFRSEAETDPILNFSGFSLVLKEIQNSRCGRTDKGVSAVGKTLFQAKARTKDVWVIREEERDSTVKLFDQLFWAESRDTDTNNSYLPTRCLD
uniref:Uncharacterized protein n=1 Tax=Salix viminalis TaxID=40686 RepID=A0A6N2NGQ4_SALVM